MRILLFLLPLFSLLSCDLSGTKDDAVAPSLIDSTALKLIKDKEPVISKKDQAHLNTKFLKFIKKRRFNGAVLIAKGNSIVFDTIVGYANVRKRIPLHDTSAMQLASISKPLTGAVILSLIKEGKIKLTDTIQHHLPRLPKGYDKITIQMLLSHQSGLTQYYYYCDHVLKDKNFILDNDSLIDVIVEHRPGFGGRAGRKFKYCNTNYALLAALAEKIEGKRFQEIVQERIIQPSGMSNSFLLDLFSDTLPANLVYGNNEWRRIVEFDYLDGIVGDKGFFSNAHDLFKFDRYFFSNEMIGDSLMQKALTAQTKVARNGNAYGLGWRLRFNDELGKIVYHPGWWRGNRHLYFKIPSKDYTVILLSNSLKGSRYNLNNLLSIFYEVE